MSDITNLEDTRKRLARSSPCAVFTSDVGRTKGWCYCGFHKSEHAEHDDAPAAPERGEWRVDGYEINDGQRSIVRAPHPDEFPGLTSEQRRRVKAASLANLTTIVTEHNQHSTLIAQRERLLEGLRLAVDWMQGKRGGPSEGLSAAQVIKRLESVITTSEREGR